MPQPLRIETSITAHAAAVTDIFMAAPLCNLWLQAYNRKHLPETEMLPWSAVLLASGPAPRRDMLPIAQKPSPRRPNAPARCPPPSRPFRPCTARASAAPTYVSTLRRARRGAGGIAKGRDRARPVRAPSTAASKPRTMQESCGTAQSILKYSVKYGSDMVRQDIAPYNLIRLCSFTVCQNAP